MNEFYYKSQTGRFMACTILAMSKGKAKQKRGNSEPTASHKRANSQPTASHKRASSEPAASQQQHFSRARARLCNVEIEHRRALRYIESHRPSVAELGNLNLPLFPGGHERRHQPPSLETQGGQEVRKKKMLRFIKKMLRFIKKMCRFRQKMLGFHLLLISNVII